MSSGSRPPEQRMNALAGSPGAEVQIWLGCDTYFVWGCFTLALIRGNSPNAGLSCRLDRFTSLDDARITASQPVRRRGGMVTQRPAKPSIPVRFRASPPYFTGHFGDQASVLSDIRADGRKRTDAHFVTAFWRCGTLGPPYRCHAQAPVFPIVPEIRTGMIVTFPTRSPPNTEDNRADA